MIKTILLIGLAFTMVSCTSDEEETIDNEEIGQQLGSTMSAVDSSSGTDSGAYAFVRGSKKTFARYKLNEQKFSFLPKAHAASCATANTFSSCTNNVITRSFNDCTVGVATFSGSVNITFDDGSIDSVCRLDSDNDTVTRVPDFVMTGRRGATLTVEKSGTIGQRITRTSVNTYQFSNDGIRRYFTLSGLNLFDFTTSTTSPIVVTGENRASRTMSGGTLQITNNSSGVSCSMTPNNLTWDGSGSCNCPVSGNWTGTCTDEKTVTVTVNSCGSGTIVVNGESQNLNFDRCY